MVAIALPAAPYWQLRLGSDGEVVTGMDELTQSLRILLNTHPGSIPLEPEFGCDTLQWVDKPDAVAIPGLIRDVSRAVARWEPRVELKSVKVVSRSLGGVTLRLTVIPAVGSAPAPSNLTSMDVLVGSGYVAQNAVGTPGGVAPLNTIGQVPDKNLPPAPASFDGDFGDLVP